MKNNKKNIVILLIIFLICSLCLKTLAIDVTPGENETENDNTIVENPEETPPSTESPDTDGDKTDSDSSDIENEPEPEQTPDSKPNEPSEEEPNQEPTEEPSKEQNKKPNKQENNKKEENKSENSYLAHLEVNMEGLSPDFSRDITQYYLIVDLEVEEIEITAIAEDAKSEVSITGNRELEEGENIIYIVVTAEAGNTTTYVINVTKTDDAERANANLKTLSVKGFNIYPSFKPNIYGYNLTITEALQQLEILPEAENEKATIEITGNENLLEGDNIIKIIVTAEDGQTKREYKINAYIASKSVQVQEENKMPAIISLGIIGILTIITLAAIIKRK